MTTHPDVPTLDLATAQAPITIPQLGFGVWQVPDSEVDAAVAAALAPGGGPPPPGGSGGWRATTHPTPTPKGRGNGRIERRASTRHTVAVCPSTTSP